MSRKRRADGTFEPGSGRACAICGADISHRRCDAWHCGEAVHGKRAWHQRERHELRMARVLKRPRCMICSAPLDPKRKGVTCGRRCAYTRWNWFRRGKAA